MGSELAEAKRRVRRRLEARRRAIAPAQAEAAGRAAAARLLAEPALAGVRVALYAALPGEMPTRPLFEALADRGIPRLLPRVLPERRLAFAPAERWEDLAPGRFGILEPDPAAEPAALGPGDLVVVPGVGFDAAGWRLGRGGGHYDRTFPAASERPGPKLVGFAFEIQIVAQLPHGSRDRGMDAIVTERRTLWATKGDA